MGQKTMKSSSLQVVSAASIIIAALIIAVADAAFSPSTFSGQSIMTGSSCSAAGVRSGSSSLLKMEYIPSGMSKAQWEIEKAKKRNANKGKNLGKVGITTFKSRSFDEWQKSGGKNLFPVDPRTVKSQSEIPYMQRRNGSADGSDLTPQKKGFFAIFGNKQKKNEK